MAITPAAPGSSGKAAPSRREGKRIDSIATDAGIERETALPHPPPRKPLRPAPPAEAAIAHPEAVAAIPAEESSASHLAGASAQTIGEVDAKFARLLAEVHENRPGDDLEIIRQAWDFCLEQHEGQKRASGDPYAVHPLEVALVLAELKMDSTAIAAGLLHDAVEDTDVTTEEIEKRFGEQVAHIVEGVTKLDKIKFANREDHQAENIRKMLLAMVTDVRVVIIKLADRLHNMRTLEHLARRSGRRSRARRWTSTRRWRTGWAWASCAASWKTWPSATPTPSPTSSSPPRWTRCAARARTSCSIVRTLEQSCRAQHRGRVEWRIKRLYSIQQKLSEQKIPLDQVYDLLAIRVICQSVQDCYAVLGLLHCIWRPVPGRIKDFIAMPRPNLYQCCTPR